MNSMTPFFWRWSADGEYSSSSTYKIQFTTNFCKTHINPIWKAKTEPKCRFFAWTLLHNKILTSDNLQKWGWPCNQICSLCNVSPKTAAHLCKDCPFAEEAWNMILTWADLRFLDGIFKTGSLHKWWFRLRMLCSKQSRKKFDGLIIYFWWSLWLERNNRIFKGQQRTNGAGGERAHWWRCSLSVAAGVPVRGGCWVIFFKRQCSI